MSRPGTTLPTSRISASRSSAMQSRSISSSASITRCATAESLRASASRTSRKIVADEVGDLDQPLFQKAWRYLSHALAELTGDVGARDLVDGLVEDLAGGPVSTSVPGCPASRIVMKAVVSETRAACCMLCVTITIV